MKKIISILCAMVLIVGCSEFPYYEIPRDANGDIILTGVSSSTTTGISVLDDQFSVTATFATAKAGDVMKVECLQLQIPQTGVSSAQLLPLAGTQKQVTVGADMKATVTYTRDEANLNIAGDYVTVVYNGATDYAIQKVTMIAATTVSKPKTSGGKEVTVIRSSEVAYFNATVVPLESAYTGELVAKMKNGKNDPWVASPGSPFSGAQPFRIPISGDDFAVGKDTMYYSFAAASGVYTEEVLSPVVVRDPFFYLKRSATLTLGSSTAAGRNLLNNAAVGANAATAIIAVSGSLDLKGGSAWLAAGKTIEFVPTTLAMFDANNSTNAIAAFAAGVPTTSANPIAGAGIYIYKIVNGANPENIFYGLLKVTSVVPGVSVTFEYRIGNMYAHLAVIQ